MRLILGLKDFIDGRGEGKRRGMEKGRGVRRIVGGCMRYF